jgi:hypothetical protein
MRQPGEQRAQRRDLFLLMEGFPLPRDFRFGPHALAQVDDGMDQRVPALIDHRHGRDARPEAPAIRPLDVHFKTVHPLALCDHFRKSMAETLIAADFVERRLTKVGFAGGKLTVRGRIGIENTEILGI